MKSIIANWKMNFSPDEARIWFHDFLNNQPPLNNIDLLIAPPFPLISFVKNLLDGYPIALTAQDVHWESNGAYTGEVSASMLKDLGCSHVIIGHSERRIYFSETDERVYLKAKKSIEKGLTPVVCVGEDRAAYEEGRAKKFILDQIQPLKSLTPLWIAYEPIWAIGTGETPNRDQLTPIINLLKEALPESRILYGGSVNSQTLPEISNAGGLQGYLIGGLSLKSSEFCAFLQHVSAQ